MASIQRPMSRHNRKYEELKITGPPLYNQSTISSFDNPPICNTPDNKCPPLEASRTALLIVDVQPEYWSKCEAVSKDFPHFPSKISSLIQNCRSQGVKCIWVRADYSYEHSPWLLQFARLHQGRIPPIVKPSSKWEEFATPLKDELVITKNSWNSTSDTGLLDTLNQDGIDTVLVCGLITSVCVQHSAFGLFEAGYRTILITDACADRGKARHEAALALYGDYMYELRTVDSVQTELNNKEINISFDGVQNDSIVKSKSHCSLTTATSHTESLSSLDQE
jgi:nicotinamidase-related amidase